MFNGAQLETRKELRRGSVLTYFGRSTRSELLPALTRTGWGVVLCGRRGASLARDVVAGGSEGALLIDPAQYDPAGAADFEGQEPKDYWLRVQLDHQVSAYLTPTTGFVGKRDQAAVRDILRSGEEFERQVRRQESTGPVFTVLPLDGRVLGREVAWLIRTLTAHSCPVGLVLADPTNPLDRPGAVEGLVHLLQALPSTALLRTDLSGLAAVANGAWFGAIGTTSSSRHLVPPGRRAGGRWGDPSPTVSVPSFADYRRGSLLERLESAGDLLACSCSVCSGANLSRFGDPLLRDEAILHSWFSTTNLANALLGYPDADRPSIWSRVCKAALDAVAVVEERTGVPLGSHAYVRAWAALA